MGEKQNNEKKRSSFSSRMGFVLSAAGASVGLGNIWRFPYLSAKYGGGIFLLVYVILAVTFGYTMIMSETAVGRMTRKSPVSAFQTFGKTPGLKFGGWINAVIPILIVPYYSVIGGWVFKYFWEYLAGHTASVAEEDFFGNFIGNGGSVVLWFVLFSVITLLVIYAGVQNGIERVSGIMMPVLIVLAVLVAGYSVTRPGAFEGVKYLLVPDFSKFSWMTVVAALGQMFYSLSIAMGILVTFGSYMKRDVSMETSTLQVELTDTFVAVLAGLMVIPSVFAFSGGDTDAMLQKGPSLMFVTLPKVFLSMTGGRIVGLMFFVLVLFAALTSSIALTEAAVATFEDELGWSRQRGTSLMGVFYIGLGLLSCLGFNVLSDVTPFGMGILDFFDFITNSVMMPVAAVCICVLVRKISMQKIEDEITAGGKHSFKLRSVYYFVMKYLAVLFILVILVTSILNVLGIISI